MLIDNEIYNKIVQTRKRIKLTRIVIILARKRTILTRKVIKLAGVIIMLARKRINRIGIGATLTRKQIKLTRIVTKQAGKMTILAGIRTMQVRKVIKQVKFQRKKISIIAALEINKKSLIIKFRNHEE